MSLPKINVLQHEQCANLTVLYDNIIACLVAAIIFPLDKHTQSHCLKSWLSRAGRTSCSVHNPTAGLNPTVTKAVLVAHSTLLQQYAGQHLVTYEM